MNTAIKQHQKKPSPSGKFQNKKVQNSRNAKAKESENLPPYAFLIMDLTGKSLDAKIIRITQLLLHKDGETEVTQHLFNNQNTAISDEAFKYHGIKAEDLQDKPSINTFNFFNAQNIVVWDGKVSTQLLRTNGVKKTAPIINLQSLARYSEPEPKPISLYNYAKKALTSKRHVISFLMQKNENKASVLRFVFEHLTDLYLKLHGVNSASFLASVGSCKTKKESIERIQKYLAYRERLNKTNKGKHKQTVATPTTPTAGTPGAAPKRKIIIVKK